MLLDAGACCIGTTWADEFGFGLSGENPWAGTPPNPQAPGRITGGSSSGSAAAVASGSCDFALGTDTAGSVRVPASWCGLWGLRPSHGALPLRGVAPLAPSLDVVGPLAADAATLERVMRVLLNGPASPPPAAPRWLGWITELWQLADPPVQAALMAEAERLAQSLGLVLEPVPLAELSLADPSELLTILQPIQWAEVERSLARIPPDLPVGPALRRNRELVAGRDRSLLEPALEKRDQLRCRLDELLGIPGPEASGAAGERLLLVPVSPCPAPPRGSLGSDRSRDGVLQRLLILGALAGLGALPQLSRPGALVDGLPVGLGVIGSRGSDLALARLDSVAPEPPALP